MSAPRIIQPPAALELTQEERIVLEAFRKMDDYGRNISTRIMQRTADARPRHAGPVLHLICGGAA